MDWLLTPKGFFLILARRFFSNQPYVINTGEVFKIKSNEQCLWHEELVIDGTLQVDDTGRAYIDG